MDDDYGKRFSDALVSEIKAEMGRQGMSSRKLGVLIGESSQYMSMRLDGGNPRTGERVLLNVRDLAGIAEALGIRASDLTLRAHFLALGGDPNLAPILERRRAENGTDVATNVVQGKFGVGGQTEDLREVANHSIDEHPQETDADFDA